MECYDAVADRAADDESPLLTAAYALPSNYVVHVVGPDLTAAERKTGVVGSKQEAKLRNCYRDTLDLCKANGRIRSIAFPCISTGLFGYPAKSAARIAVDEVYRWLQQHMNDVPCPIDHVVFNVFSDVDFVHYTDIIKEKLNLDLPSGLMTMPLRESADLNTATTWLRKSTSILITSGAGLSASAGLDYTSTSLIQEHFPAMKRYNFHRMYDALAFGPKDWPSERVRWGYLFSQVDFARFGTIGAEADVYASLNKLRNLMHRQGKQIFAATTNVDGFFLQSGWTREKLYTPQGDYANSQCLRPCEVGVGAIWQTKPLIDKALPCIDTSTMAIQIPAGDEEAEFLPRCPRCNGPAFMNVRGGSWFDDSAYAVQRQAFDEFVDAAVADGDKGLTVVEIGCGSNTPGVLRYPMQKLCEENENVRLVRINAERGNEFTKAASAGRTVELQGDATDVVRTLVDGLTLDLNYQESMDCQKGKDRYFHVFDIRMAPRLGAVTLTGEL